MTTDRFLQVFQGKFRIVRIIDSEGKKKLILIEESEFALLTDHLIQSFFN